MFYRPWLYLLGLSNILRFTISFDSAGYKVRRPRLSYYYPDEPARPVPIETYVDYCLFTCTMHFLHTHLKCCLSCGLTTHDNLSFCHDDCSDCSHTPNFSSSCGVSQTSIMASWSNFFSLQRLENLNSTFLVFWNNTTFYRSELTAQNFFFSPFFESILHSVKRGGLCCKSWAGIVISFSGIHLLWHLFPLYTFFHTHVYLLFFWFMLTVYK